MTRPPTTSFGTLTDSESAVVPSAPSEPPKAKEAPAPSLPPPPPESALRASASRPPPRPSTARPTTRGLAPPPPPRAEGTQQIDLEQIELMGEDAVQEEVPTGGADQTMELSPDHFVAVESAPEKPSKERDDLTVPVRLDQILAIAPAKLRASVAPPAHPEPARSPHPEPAPVDARASSRQQSREQSKVAEPRPALSAASSHDVTHPGLAKSNQPVAPQQTMFVEDEHETPPFAGADGQGGMPAPNFGALFGDLPPPNPSARFGQAEQEPDDSGAVQTIVAHRPGPHNAERPFDHIVPGDDDASTAMAGAAPDDSDERALRGRGISDSLRPFLQGPLRDPRKVAIGVAAAAAAGLLIFGVTAMVSDDADDLAARPVATGEQAAAGAQVEPTPSVEPRPSVEPAPSVVALAATPKRAKEAPAERAREPAAPPSAAEIPPPSVTAEAINSEAAASAEPVPAAKLPSASSAQTAPVAKPAKLSRAEKRRLQREERARAAAAKAAEKQAQKSAKPEKSGGASGDRVAKATAARDEARDAYSAGNYKAAAQAYERAIQYDPSNVKLFAGLGMTRTKLHDLKGAAAAYERAVQLSPSSSVYHLSLGRLYAAIGDKNKAKAAYKKALALDPKNAAVASELKALGG